MPERRTVALLGGSGFIGTRLAALLESRNCDVVVGDLVRPRNGKTRYSVCDILDRGSVARCIAGCDLVYLLAAEHRDDVSPVERYFRVNCRGTENVCSVMSELGIRKLVFTSSAAVYGPTGDEPADESMPMRPFNHYGKSKAQAEAIVSEWQRNGADRVASILRPTVVFGEGNRGNVYTLAHQIARGRFLMIGTGTNRKSMAFVENVAAALEWAADLPPGCWIYNYADGPDLTTRELVSLACAHLRDGKHPRRIPKIAAVAAATLLDAIADLSGRKFPISRVRIEKFCSTTRFSAARIGTAGFRPAVSLRDGLLAMLDAEFPSRLKQAESQDESEYASAGRGGPQQSRLSRQHAAPAYAGIGETRIPSPGICAAPEG